jgi:transposase
MLGKSLSFAQHCQTTIIFQMLVVWRAIHSLAQDLCVLQICRGLKWLQIPENIGLVYLPPYSPELNPGERLWRWLKGRSLRRRFQQKLESIMDTVQFYIQRTTRPFRKGLRRRGYLLH